VRGSKVYVIGAGKGNRTLVISLEVGSASRNFNGRSDKSAVWPH